MLFLTIIWNVGGFNLIALGLKYNVSATSASFLQQSNSLFLLLFSFVFLKEKINLRTSLYLTLSFIGVLIFFMPSFTGINFNFGSFFIILSALLWAVGMILFKKWNIDGSIGTVIWMAGLASLVQAPLTFFSVPTENFIFSFEIALYALGAFLLSSVFANSLWLHATRLSRGASLSYLVLLTPLVVLIGDSYIMGNNMKTNELIRGFLILTSGFWRFLSNHNNKKNEKYIK